MFGESQWTLAEACDPTHRVGRVEESHLVRPACARTPAAAARRRTQHFGSGPIREHVVHSAELRDQVQVIEQAKALVSLLTAREKEIATKIVDGNSNKEIARDLDISPRTVEVHRANIFKKLDVRNAVEFALIFEKAQLSPRSLT